MRRYLAAAWLVVLLLLSAYLAWNLHAGLRFSTDILALLPREAETPLLKQANDAVTEIFSRRVILLVGNQDRDAARQAAMALGDALAKADLLKTDVDAFSGDRLKKLGSLYFPYRQGLLSERDRNLLQQGKGADVATAALAQIYGFAGMADSRLIAQDPFLLLQSFLTQLPIPLSRLTLDDGLLTVRDGDLTWILVTGQLNGEPFSFDAQDKFIGKLDNELAHLKQSIPDLQVKRLGAVFFAADGSKVAMAETSTLGLISMVGAVLLLLLTFRRLAPLWQNLLVIAIGAGVALAVSLMLFDQLHVAVLLFGVSLIGIAVDYGMYYYSTLFDPDCRTPEQRLQSVWAGISLGFVTTLIGYAILILAPFPGLRQIAIFSVIGLCGSFVTVVLWFPLIDRNPPAHHGALLLRSAGALWDFWEAPKLRMVRLGLIAILSLATLVGLTRIRADDDVRRLQSLSADLVAQQNDIQRLIGSTGMTQFILVHEPSDEAALQTEERLEPLLRQLRDQGALAAYQSPAAYVPSAARQRDNRRLVSEALDQPYLAAQAQQLGLPMTARDKGVNSGVLTLDQAMSGGAAPFLRHLVLKPGIHVVTLDGLQSPEVLRTALTGWEGVRLVDPAGDYTTLLSKYRHRALWLIVFAILLMMPVLIWRYGWLGAILVKAPSVAAISLALASIGLLGEGFNFFHAMALILVQSIGVDYAVFCAESGKNRRAVTMLGVWLSALSTLLSFGVLAFSQVAAVHAFGLTMLIGILFAFILAPVAGKARKRVRKGKTSP